MKEYRYNAANLVEWKLFHWDLRIEVPRSEQHRYFVTVAFRFMQEDNTVRVQSVGWWTEIMKGYTYKALAMKFAEPQQQLGWCCLSQSVDSLLAVLVLHFPCSPDGCCLHAEPGMKTWSKVRFWVSVKMEQTEQLFWPHAQWAMSWISKDLQHCS